MKKNNKCPSISVIRVCGDRPLIQPQNINILINENYKGLSYNHHDYKNNYLGYGAERLSAKLTSEFFLKNHTEYADKEHVTKNIYSIESIKKKCLWDSEIYNIVKKLNLEKLDLDTDQDFERLEKVVKRYSLSPFRRLPI